MSRRVLTGSSGNTVPGSVAKKSRTERALAGMTRLMTVSAAIMMEKRLIS